VNFESRFLKNFDIELPYHPADWWIDGRTSENRFRGLWLVNISAPTASAGVPTA
jgi:hypothetical protein